MAGWTAKLDRDPNGAYRSVTFTATPNAGIPPGQFELFGVSVQLPDADSVSLPVVQTYAGGTVVRWDQPPLPNGDEPEFPAPVLALTTGPREPEEHHATPTAPPESAAPSVSAVPAAQAQAAAKASPDNTARAGRRRPARGAIGVGMALTRRRA